MKKITFLFFILLSFISNAQLLTENFDATNTLTGNGWTILNVSNPVGSNTWQQGSGGYGSHSGSITSYISANSSCTNGTGTISAWLILPSLSLKDGDKINFYTRSDNQASFPDRLQVRLSANGNSSITPTDEVSVGDYTTLLLDINPTLTTNVYPETYTEYEVTITGIGSIATSSRIAFRYFVTNGGPTGSNSNAIALDSLTVTEQTLSSEEDLNTNVFSYFYNKETQILNLRSSDLNFKNIELYNILGQNVLTKSLNNNTETINIENLKSGIYIAKVNTEGKNETFKILKQ